MSGDEPPKRIDDSAAENAAAPGTPPSSPPESDGFDALRARLRLAEDRTAEVVEACRRMQRDNEDFRDETRQKLERQFVAGRDQLLLASLAVLDRLDAAIGSAREGQADDALVQGIVLVRTLLQRTLQEEGLEILEVEGRAAHPGLTTVVGSEAVEDASRRGVVLRVLQPGVRIEGRVVRPAAVVVGADSAEVREHEEAAVPEPMPRVETAPPSDEVARALPEEPPAGVPPPSPPPFPEPSPVVEPAVEEPRAVSAHEPPLPAAASGPVAPVEPAAPAGAPAEPPLRPVVRPEPPLPLFEIDLPSESTAPPLAAARPTPRSATPDPAPRQPPGPAQPPPPDTPSARAAPPKLPPSVPPASPRPSATSPPTSRAASQEATAPVMRAPPRRRSWLPVTLGAGAGLAAALGIAASLHLWESPRAGSRSAPQTTAARPQAPTPAPPAPEVVEPTAPAAEAGAGAPLEPSSRAPAAVVEEAAPNVTSAPATPPPLPTPLAPSPRPTRSPTAPPSPSADEDLRLRRSAEAASFRAQAESAAAQGRHDEAVGLYDQALRLEPEEGRAQEGRSRALEARELARRRFVAGRTDVQTPDSRRNLSGFETSEVNLARAPKDSGAIEFETSPARPRPGEALTVRVYLVNTGKKGFKIQKMTVTTTVDGKPQVDPVTPRVDEVPPRGRGLLFETTEPWKQHTTSWSAEVVVLTPREEAFTARLTWK